MVVVVVVVVVVAMVGSGCSAFRRSGYVQGGWWWAERGNQELVSDSAGGTRHNGMEKRGEKEREKRRISSIFFQRASQDETVREVAGELVEKGGWAERKHWVTRQKSKSRVHGGGGPTSIVYSLTGASSSSLSVE